MTRTNDYALGSIVLPNGKTMVPSTRVLGRATMVYRGSINEVQMRLAEIFKHAIRLNAAALIVAHSHPSGDPSPSSADVHVTREIIKAGKLLEIEVVDHLVVCGTGSGEAGRWLSLKERGMGFE